jgi:hypothetical protein
MLLTNLALDALIQTILPWHILWLFHATIHIFHSLKTTNPLQL